MIGGAGSVFCSGADLAGVEGPHGLDFLAAFERTLAAVARHRLPTVARIQGAALGGGLQLATVCDFRICAQDSRLGIPSSRLGVVVNLENVERLVDLVGFARAAEVLMTARTYTGAEAMEAGLVTQAVAAEDLERSAHGLASRIAALAPRSVQGAKRAIRLIAEERSVRALDARAAREIDALVAEAYASDDLAEGMSAMTEKRPPEFRGS